MKRLPAPLSLMLLAAVLAMPWTVHGADAAKPAAPKPALTVSLAAATQADLPIRLSANGSIAAWQEAIVGAEVGGLRVQSLHAAIGDNVKRGQTLASFADETVRAEVALARAQLQEAQANAGDAAANAERAKALQGSGALSPQQIGQYLTLAQTASARVASAQAQLAAQELRLKHTRLLAPEDGVVSARVGTVGAVVGPGTEMFRLIVRGRIEWRGEVAAGEIERLKPGLKVLLTSPGDAQARGTIRMVAPTIDPATRKGLVYADLAPGAGSAFKPGVYVRGDVDLGQSSALTVPKGAVVVRDGFSYVFRVGPDNRVSQRKVQTGRLVSERLEVLEGLSAGDKVVASGGSFLSDGDLVRIAATPAASK